MHHAIVEMMNHMVNAWLSPKKLSAGDHLSRFSTKTKLMMADTKRLTRYDNSTNHFVLRPAIGIKRINALIKFSSDTPATKVMAAMIAELIPTR